MRKEVK